ncbi:serine/threonine protein kinase, putative [Plasmodium ovale]|uniref:Serine/threonine protein kinase, putative n=1 Tax=Plasmodium ovale TaxID=36330 RepID=A0A1D3TLP1_PLAOA|nr:serine/threonine protein kinase, putative [Plasmodium ovale]
MLSNPKWRTEWDKELRLIPQVESVAESDLQLTENVFLIWQFLKLYHSSVPQVKVLIDFIAAKNPESLQWGEHIDGVMSRGLTKGQDLFNLLISNGKKIQSRYSKKKLCDTLQYYHIKNYIILEKINTGSVGQVHLALDKTTDMLVAAKAIDKSTVQGDAGLFQKLKEEIKVSCKMNHPYVVKTINVLETKDKIIQVMEFCDGGDLISYVRNKQHLEEISAQYFFRKIVEGLKYMHRNNIAHRDLKPENIFLCKKSLNQREKTLIRIGKLPSCFEYELKIGDFGACCFNEKNKLHYDIVGTLSYAAPEVLGCNNTNGYNSEKADVWSLGIILYAMLFGLLPFDNEDKQVKEAYNEIMNNKIIYPKNRINKFSINVRNLLSGILNSNPFNRLSLDEVINHEWLIDKAKTKLEMSYVNKKINFPISSTVGCPIYANKNIVDYNFYRKINLIKTGDITLGDNTCGGSTHGGSTHGGSTHGGSTHGGSTHSCNTNITASISNYTPFGESDKNLLIRDSRGILYTPVRNDVNDKANTPYGEFLLAYRNNIFDINNKKEKELKTMIDVTSVNDKKGEPTPSRVNKQNDYDQIHCSEIDMRGYKYGCRNYVDMISHYENKLVGSTSQTEIASCTGSMCTPIEKRKQPMECSRNEYNNAYDLHIGKKIMFENKRHHIIPSKEKITQNSNSNENVYFLKSSDISTINENNLREVISKTCANYNLVNTQGGNDTYRMKYISNGSSSKNCNNAVTPGNSFNVISEKRETVQMEIPQMVKPNYQNVQYNYYYYDDKGVYVRYSNNGKNDSKYLSSCFTPQNEENCTNNYNNVNFKYFNEGMYRRGISEYVDACNANYNVYQTGVKNVKLGNQNYEMNDNFTNLENIIHDKKKSKDFKVSTEKQISNMRKDKNDEKGNKNANEIVMRRDQEPIKVAVEHKQDKQKKKVKGINIHNDLGKINLCCSNDIALKMLYNDLKKKDTCIIIKDKVNDNYEKNTQSNLKNGIKTTTYVDTLSTKVETSLIKKEEINHILPRKSDTRSGTNSNTTIRTDEAKCTHSVKRKISKSSSTTETQHSNNIKIFNKKEKFIVNNYDIRMSTYYENDNTCFPPTSTIDNADKGIEKEQTGDTLTRKVGKSVSTDKEKPDNIMFCQRENNHFVKSSFSLSKGETYQGGNSHLVDERGGKEDPTATLSSADGSNTGGEKEEKNKKEKEKRQITDSGNENKENNRLDTDSEGSNDDSPYQHNGKTRNNNYSGSYSGHHSGGKNARGEFFERGNGRNKDVDKGMCSGKDDGCKNARIDAKVVGDNNRDDNNGENDSRRNVENGSRGNDESGSRGSDESGSRGSDELGEIAASDGVRQCSALLNRRKQNRCDKTSQVTCQFCKGEKETEVHCNRELKKLGENEEEVVTVENRNYVASDDTNGEHKYLQLKNVYCPNERKTKEDEETVLNNYISKCTLPCSNETKQKKKKKKKKKKGYDNEGVFIIKEKKKDNESSDIILKCLENDIVNFTHRNKWLYFNKNTQNGIRSNENCVYKNKNILQKLCASYDDCSNDEERVNFYSNKIDYKRISTLRSRCNYRRCLKCYYQHCNFILDNEWGHSKEYSPRFRVCKDTKEMRNKNVEKDLSCKEENNGMITIARKKGSFPEEGNVELYDESYSDGVLSYSLNIVNEKEVINMENRGEESNDQNEEHMGSHIIGKPVYKYTQKGHPTPVVYFPLDKHNLFNEHLSITFNEDSTLKTHSTEMASNSLPYLRTTISLIDYHSIKIDDHIFEKEHTNSYMKKEKKGEVFRIEQRHNVEVPVNGSFEKGIIVERYTDGYSDRCNRCNRCDLRDALFVGTNPSIGDSSPNRMKGRKAVEGDCFRVGKQSICRKNNKGVKVLPEAVIVAEQDKERFDPHNSRYIPKENSRISVADNAVEDNDANAQRQRSLYENEKERKSNTKNGDSPSYESEHARIEIGDECTVSDEKQMDESYAQYSGENVLTSSKHGSGNANSEKENPFTEINGKMDGSVNKSNSDCCCYPQGEEHISNEKRSRADLHTDVHADIAFYNHLGIVTFLPMEEGKNVISKNTCINNIHTSEVVFTPAHMHNNPMEVNAHFFSTKRYFNAYPSKDTHLLAKCEESHTYKGSQHVYTFQEGTNDGISDMDKGTNAQNTVVEFENDVSRKDLIQKDATFHTQIEQLGKGEKVTKLRGKTLIKEREYITSNVFEEKQTHSNDQRAGIIQKGKSYKMDEVKNDLFNISQKENEIQDYTCDDIFVNEKDEVLSQENVNLGECSEKDNMYHQYNSRPYFLNSSSNLDSLNGFMLYSLSHSNPYNSLRQGYLPKQLGIKGIVHASNIIPSNGNTKRRDIWENTKKGDTLKDYLTLNKTSIQCFSKTKRGNNSTKRMSQNGMDESALNPPQPRLKWLGIFGRNSTKY